MTLIHKITTGVVTQVFDTEKGDYVEQNFTASDEVCYETPIQDSDGNFLDEQGNVVDDPAAWMLNSRGIEPYLPFNMVQPEQKGRTKRLF